VDFRSDEWNPLPGSGKNISEKQNTSGMLQWSQDISPQLEKSDHDQPREEFQHRNIDPQAMQELTQLLKKLQADIDRLLKIFNK
jgi:hypothetical protein